MLPRAEAIPHVVQLLVHRASIHPAPGEESMLDTDQGVAALRQYLESEVVEAALIDASARLEPVIRPDLVGDEGHVSVFWIYKRFSQNKKKGDQNAK
jgi:hypothetical protein